MVIFNWKLFEWTIPEQTNAEFSPNPQDVPHHLDMVYDTPEATEEFPGEQEGRYAISEAVLEAYYVTMLRQIDTHEQQDKKQFLDRVDDALNDWVERGKALVSSWEQRYRNLPQRENERLKNAVIRYAEEAYRRLGRDGQERENLPALSREIVAGAGGQENPLPDTELAELQVFLARLNALFEQAVQQTEVRRRIYARLRRLPQYLGTPYAQRYALYRQLRQYSLLTGAGRASTVVYMVLDAESFQGYCENHIQKMADHISRIQGGICRIGTPADLFQWDNTYNDLRNQLREWLETNKEYRKGKRCFALIEVFLHSGIVKYYLSFSGLFDSKDPVIQSRFGTYPQLDRALTQIGNAVRSQLNIPATRVTATVDIRYYYSANQSVTLGQACRQMKGDFCKIKRMFSCCERKFFTELETIPAADVRRYKMYIKLNPCELCQTAIDDFEQQGYRNRIIAGKAVNPRVAHKSLYDGLAQDIAASKTGIVFHIP